MKTQDAILDLLKDKPSPVLELASKTATSPGYIRTQLKALEAANIVRRVDDRQPFYYEINPDSHMIKNKELVTKAKAMLMNPDPEHGNWVAKKMKAIDKAQWEEGAGMLEAFAQAIKELDKEGKLVDTL